MRFLPPLPFLASTCSPSALSFHLALPFSPTTSFSICGYSLSLSFTLSLLSCSLWLFPFLHPVCSLSLSLSLLPLLELQAAGGFRQITLTMVDQYSYWSAGKMFIKSSRAAAERWRWGKKGRASRARGGPMPFGRGWGGIASLIGCPCARLAKLRVLFRHDFQLLSHSDKLPCAAKQHRCVATAVICFLAASQTVTTRNLLFIRPCLPMSLRSSFA